MSIGSRRSCRFPSRFFPSGILLVCGKAAGGQNPSKMELAWTIVLVGSLCLSGVIQTEATTTSPGCQYDVRNGTRNSGASQQTSINTIDDCRNFCDMQSTCIAYEWQRPDTECWIYTQFSGGDISAPNNDLYVKLPNTCPDGTATASTSTSTTTTASTTTTSSSGCTDTFTSRPGMNRQGGVQRVGISTQLNCQNDCLSRPFADCAAYDFNTNANTCWHIAESVVQSTNAQANSNVNHFERVRCSVVTGTPACLDTFTDMTDMGVTGGIRQPGITTVQACQTACRGQTIAVCAGFDFDQSQCWFHTQNNLNTNQPRSRPGVTHYVRVACDATTTTGTPTPAGTICTDTFRMDANTNYAGGQQQTSANTVQLCQQACLATSTCSGLDFNRVSSQCFLHDRTQTYTNPLNGQGGQVDHYRRIPCNDTATPTGCTDTFSPSNEQLFGGQFRGSLARAACELLCLNSICSHFEINERGECFTHMNATGTPRQAAAGHTLYRRIPCATTTITGVCRDSFTESANTLIFGGVASPGATTSDACLAACLDRSPVICTGFDFDLNLNECFLHNEVTIRQNPSTATRVNHFRRNFDCNGTSSSSGVCQDTFVSTADQFRSGGSLVQGISTDADCRAECLRTSNRQDANTCYGYDFNSRSNECFLHRGSLPSITGGFPGVTTYARQFICEVSTTPGDICTDSFTPTQNANVPGGTLENGANTEPLCRAACLADRGTVFCYGFDFNSNNECFLYTVSADYVLNTNSPGVTHYRRNRICASSTPGGCQEQYNITQDRNVGGGIDVGQQTVQQCMQLCEGNRTNTCYGFDVSGGQCWILETQDYVFNTGASPGVTNYRRLFACAGASTTGGVCVDTFTLRPNFIIYGGRPVPSAITVDACSAACRAEARTACSGFNYDRAATVKCYLISGPLDGAQNDNNLDLYARDNNCASLTSTIPSTTCEMRLVGTGNVAGGVRVVSENTLAGCNNYCLNSATCMAIDFDSNQQQCFWFSASGQTPSGDLCCQHYSKVCTGTCVDTYNMTTGFGYPSGMEVPNRRTVMECQTACTESMPCEGFDFNTQTSQCYTHPAANLAPGRGSARNNVDHYRRVRCPNQQSTTLPTTIRTTTCPIRYTSFPDMNARGGIRQPTINTVVDCQAACNNDQNCGALDFDTVLSACFLHVGTPNMIPSSGVTHYRKVPCATPAPTPAPTPSPIPQVCNLDLTFIVDTSEHVGNSPLRIERTNVQLDIINNLNVGTGNNARVFSRIFGGTSQPQYAPAASTNPVAIQSVLQTNFPVTIAGSSNVAGALRDYRDNEFTLSSGRQPVVVLMTNFTSFTGLAPIIASWNSLTQQGLRTFVVHANNLNQQNIQSFFPGTIPVPISRVLINDGSITRAITDAYPLCRRTGVVPTVTPAPPPPPRQCVGDIAVLIDNSGSIRDQTSGDNWVLVVNFVRALVNQFRAVPNTRIALVRFSTNTTVVHRFTDPVNTNLLQNRVQQLQGQFDGGVTNLQQALDVLRTQVFTFNGGDRQSEPNVLLIITDGDPTDLRQPGQVSAAIQQLRASTVGQSLIVIPVGVTTRVRQATLMEMAATNPVTGLPIISVSNFGQLQGIVGTVVGRTCNAVRR